MDRFPRNTLLDEAAESRRRPTTVPADRAANSFSFMNMGTKGRGDQILSTYSTTI